MMWNDGTMKENLLKQSKNAKSLGGELELDECAAASLVRSAMKQEPSHMGSSTLEHKHRKDCPIMKC